MPSLADIAPPDVATETLSITRGDTQIDFQIKGVSLYELTRIVARFPVLGKRMLDRGAGEAAAAEMMSEMTAEMVIEAADMMPAMIAAGFGTPDENGEKLVRERLSEDEQRQAFDIVMRLTGGGKAGVHAPFANGEAAVEQSGAAPDTNSPKQ